MLLTKWFERVKLTMAQAVFVVWTALLTYLNGPYYALLELARNLQIFGLRKLDYEKEFPESLENKVCVITGGTRGIGLEVVRFLMYKGCTVVTGTSSMGNNPTNSQIEAHRVQLLADVMDDPWFKDHDSQQLKTRLKLLPLDLASMDSVVTFSANINRLFDRIDYLICNGGVMFVPYKQSGDGFEHHNAINYYSHALLTLKLLPKLRKASQARITIVSSGAHHASYGLRLEDFNSSRLYSIYHAYAQSKLAMVMFTYSLHRMLQATRVEGQALSETVSVNSLHPGICRTNMMQGFNFFKIKALQDSFLFRSAKDGAETILYVALSDKVNDVSGKYFENCSPAKSSSISYNEAAQDKLWSETWNSLGKWLTRQELDLIDNNNIAHQS